MQLYQDSNKTQFVENNGQALTALNVMCTCVACRSKQREKKDSGKKKMMELAKTLLVSRVFALVSAIYNKSNGTLSCVFIFSTYVNT